MRRPLLLASLLLLAIAATGEAAPTAPAFRVKTLDGRRTIDTRELLGKKVLVLRFQASYCKPCAKEAGPLTRIAERYRDRDVEVVAIHVQDTAADARAFARTHKMTIPIVLDPRLTIGNRFGFKGSPYTVVIDRRGEMVARIHGESAVTRLPRLLDAALAQDAPGS
ncbi:MAG TPA: TlpA disulfide reductase family protein [Methylomirabilota bacterium]|nr:TlpA disulfide reductase family protein [Methylomirabilota bacterium]